MPAEPFSYAALPQLTHEAAQAASSLARGATHLSLEAALTAIERVVGARPLVTRYAVETWPPASALQRPEPNLVALVIGDGVASRDRAVLELDPTLAGYLVDRALGASLLEPRLAPGPVTEGERGALAYVAASALAQVHGAHRLLGVISTVEAFAHALGDGFLVAVPARVELAGVVGWARLYCTPAAVRAQPLRPADPSIELDLRILAGTATLAAHEVAALGIGDVVLPEQWTARPEAQQWIGPLRAASPHGGPSLRLMAGPALVVEASEDAPPRTSPASRESQPMSTEQRNRVDEVPVELAIEVGRLALTVGELGALAPGAVLATGLPTGHPITLRVGARVVARGELVVVEGEVGVRITEVG